MSNPFQPTALYMAASQALGSIHIPRPTAGIHWGVYMRAGGIATYMGKR
jgi:hypothetical protein